MSADGKNEKTGIKINENDNVATLTEKGEKREKANIIDVKGKKVDEVSLKTKLPAPLHKIALKNIKKDEKVYKYGNPIGKATKSIERGEWIHTHNLKSSNLSED